MIFAFPGSDMQQLGGDCPTGWVQMQSVRPDSSGWVAAKDGIWVQYVPSISTRLVALTTEYNKDINELCSGMLSALLKDGAVMDSKFSSIREASNQRKIKYLDDKNKLLNEV